MKCCLADLAVSVGSWTPDAVQWLREKVLNTTDCSMKVNCCQSFHNSTNLTKLNPEYVMSFFKYTYLSFHLYYSSLPPFGLHQGDFLFASCLPLFFLFPCTATLTLNSPRKGCQGRRNQALHLRPPFHWQELPRPSPQPQPSDGPVWPVQTATRCFPHEPQVHSTFIFTFTIPFLSILLVPNLGALNSTRGLQSFLGFTSPSSL